MSERYEFLRKIAQGGFGRVYVAKDTRLGREVAIKRLLSREESASFELAQSTFEREATTLAAMQHPNIVQVYDFDRDEEGTYVVMEMLAGETLKDRLNRGPLTWDTFVMVARQALDAINAAHSQGILHRDLKPENLFLQTTPSGTRVLKILDFGLAKLSNVPSRQTMDQSGNVFGSIYYMAPEQFMRQPLDGRTDLYALGCVFYQALTGKFAFIGEDMQGNMEAHMEHKVRPIRDRRPDLSAPVCDWLMRMISFAPQDRPPDAMTALREFEAALEGKTWQPPPKKPAPPPPGSPSAPALRHPARAGAGQPTSRPSNPPTSKPGPPSGTRPSGAEPAAGGLQNRPVSAVDAGRAEAKAKVKDEAVSQRKSLALKIGITVALVALLGSAAILYLQSKSKAGTTSAPAVTQTAAASAQTEAPKVVAKNVSPPAPVKVADPGPSLLPETAPLALPMEGLLVWRFRAGAESRHRNTDGKMEMGKLHRGQTVHAWGNVASGDHSAMLSLAEGKAERWPIALADDVKGAATNHTFFYFLPDAGMEVKLKAAELAQAPGSATSDPPGVTMAAVFRANGRTKETVMRPLVLTGPSPRHAFSLHFDHRAGKYWVVAEREGETVQCLAAVEELATPEGGADAKWVVAVASWDSKQGNVNLRVRSPEGKKGAAPEAPIAKGMAAFDRMGLGLVKVPKESKLNPDEKFEGDIIEVAVYRRALDAATQDKLLGALWDRYFKKQVAR